MDWFKGKSTGNHHHYMKVGRASNNMNIM
jgi:hypothetical protein